MDRTKGRYVVTEEQIEKLLSLFRDCAGMSQEQAEGGVHALVDIAESMFEIYDVILPCLTSQPSSGKSTLDLKDTLWELREELRHIDYHVHDSGLLDI
jgi:hypothetical protein